MASGGADLGSGGKSAERPLTQHRDKTGTQKGQAQVIHNKQTCEGPWTEN